MLRIPAFPLFCFAIFLFCIPVGQEFGSGRTKPAPTTPPKAPDAASVRVFAAKPSSPSTSPEPPAIAATEPIVLAIPAAATPDSALAHTHGSPRSLVVHDLH